MRLLFLSPRECWPPTSGAKLRDYHLARALAKRSKATYVFFGSEETAAQLRQKLGDGTEVAAVPPPAKYTAKKIIRGLLGRYPLPVENYTSSEMSQRIAEVAESGAFSAVHLDSIHFAAYLPLLRKLLPKARVMLNWHNIESELMERYAESTVSPARKVYAKLTARQMRRLEDEMLRSCYGHVVCSERELRELVSRGAAARIEVAANGVDASYFFPRDAEPIQSRLVFVGQMSYHANADGAGWFVREVWPSIRERHPDFQLSIVGSGPGPSVQRLAREPGVEVTGTVPDVRPYYSGAYAAIVPLLTGGGTRLKILEAMAAGTPVISTRIGAEGLPVMDRQEFLLADNVQAWHDALEFLSDCERRRDLAGNARHLVTSQFDWTAIGEGVLRLYEKWVRAE